MNIEQLPTKGQHYGSGEAITEINAIIDSIFSLSQDRCDCDSHTRCIHCRLDSELKFKKEALKKRLQELIDKIEEEQR